MLPAMAEALNTEVISDTVLAQVERAREDCVTAVPTFSIQGFLLPGAQKPNVLAHTIRRILDKRRSE